VGLLVKGHWFRPTCRLGLYDRWRATERNSETSTSPLSSLAVIRLIFVSLRRYLLFLGLEIAFPSLSVSRSLCELAAMSLSLSAKNKLKLVLPCTFMDNVSTYLKRRNSWGVPFSGIETELHGRILLRCSSCGGDHKH
jgi:hypothetical protein